MQCQSTLRNLFGLISLLVMSNCSKSPDGGSSGNPVVSVSPVSANEGTSTNTFFNFDFTLSAASDKQVSFTVSTADVAAVAGKDYIAIPATELVFKPGETRKTVKVEIIADEWKENTEPFQVQIQNLVNCTIASNAVRGHIQNDDEKIFFEDNGYTSPISYPGYSLVWADEFDGTSLNTNDWNFETGDGCPNVCGWGNNELEWYTPGDNLYMQRGKMIIEARAETKNGKNYTSTRITTQNKKTFTYGRIDIRAKMPYGQGIWPALWMLGANIPTVSWPACGEMDILELLGHEPNKMYSTAHFATGSGPRNISKSITSTTSYSDAFHVYSLVWVQDKIRFLVDDQLVNEVNKIDVSPSNYPFNAPFFFIINVAVGGNWPGSPNNTTTFPQWLFVDYVRVFQ